MSRISDQIRAYVDDPTTAEHYGAWGILRPDQRRLIRNLCDICDMYERTADLAVAEREANVKGFLAQVEELNARCLNAKKEAAKQIFEEIETLLCYSVTPKINANGTITSVKSRDYYIRRDDYTELKKKYCGEDTNVPTKLSAEEAITNFQAAAHEYVKNNSKKIDSVKIIVRENCQHICSYASAVGVKYKVNGREEGRYREFDVLELTVPVVVETLNKIFQLIFESGEEGEA